MAIFRRNIPMPGSMAQAEIHGRHDIRFLLFHFTGRADYLESEAVIFFKLKMPVNPGNPIVILNPLFLCQKK